MSRFLQNFVIFTFFSWIFAADPKNSYVDGVAVLVNGEPITLFEIQKRAQAEKISQKDAREKLISDRLKDAETARLGIKITDEIAQKYIESIADQNGLSISQLFAQVRLQEGKNEEEFVSVIKDQLKNQQLIQYVLLQHNSPTNAMEMKNYYENHKDEFAIPKTVALRQFRSRDRARLEKNMQNPDEIFPGVEQFRQDLATDEMPPQLLDIVIDTPEKNFTKIIENGDIFVTIFIEKKLDVRVLGFDEAREMIAQKIAKNRTSRVLDDYFQKIRAKADIKTIR